MLLLLLRMPCLGLGPAWWPFLHPSHTPTHSPTQPKPTHSTLEHYRGSESPLGQHCPRFPSPRPRPRVACECQGLPFGTGGRGLDGSSGRGLGGGGGRGTTWV